MQSHSPISSSAEATLEEEAALWLLNMVDPDVEVRAKFLEWKTQTPNHEAAYLRALAAYNTARDVSDTPEILRIRNEALSRNAVRAAPWYKFTSVSNLGKIAACGVFALGLAASAALMTFSDDFGLTAQQSPLTQTEASAVQTAENNVYTTNIGERLNVTLDDGTVITVDTNSQINVQFTQQQRFVSLLKGRASFDVAHDKARPFIVAVNDKMVTALGTSFDVSMINDEVVVTLAEGKVRIEAPKETVEDNPILVELLPGQQFIEAQNSAAKVLAVDAEKSLSWRKGLLIFDDKTLGESIKEMNRYSHRTIIIENSAVSDLKMTGAFHAGQTQEFVEAVTQYFSLSVEHRSDEIILSSSQ